MSDTELSVLSSTTRDLGGEAAGGAEVVAYDPARKLTLALGPNGINILDTATGDVIGAIPKSAILTPDSVPGVSETVLPLGTANSIAIHGDIVAIALDGPATGENGAVAFFQLNGDGSAATWIRTVTGPSAGSFAVPDMLTFTPDGSKVIVAIEGEPVSDYSTDPTGGVGIIDTATGALQIADFTGFNDDRAALIAAGLRLNGPGSTLAQDVEPEYLAVTSDGSTAYVTLQEANAIAEVDLAAATVTRIMPLGVKDHSAPGQGIDPSDEDGVTAVQEVPVFGLYMPDAIAVLEQDGKTYLVTANEGDGREYDAIEDEIRVEDLTLDPVAFPDAASLQQEENLGRLTVSATDGDIDGDGDHDLLYSLGARSFSIWEVTDGGLVQTYDSGDLIERTLFEQFPALVDDGRSDNKGPEPEHLTLATIDGNLFAFVGLERSNAVMAFEIESPTKASFAGLVNTPGDEAPEVFTVVPETDAPAGSDGPLLIVPNEGSGTVTTYELATDSTFTLQILHASDFEAGIEATQRAKNFAAIVDVLEDSYANSITLSSGDNFIPGPFTAAGADPAVLSALRSYYEQKFGVSLPSLSLDFNHLDIAILNEIGVQASVIGNHEFDLGPNAFNNAINFAGSDAAVSAIGAQFPYLSANFDFSGDSGLNGNFTSALLDAATYAAFASDGVLVQDTQQDIAPWTTIQEGGETIGILGVTTQILQQISSTGSVTAIEGPGSAGGGDGLDNDMDELAAILQPYVDQMIAQGIDKIILLSHLQQYQFELELATKLSGVDIIISGGSHAVFADDTDTLDAGDTAAEGYPVFRVGLDGNPVAVVNTGANYEYVGRLAVTFDSNGVIIPESVDPTVSGAYVTTDAGVDAVAGDGDGTLSQAEQDVIFADGTRGGEVKQLTDAVAAVITEKDSNVTGFTNVFLEGRRNEVRAEETNLGNLTADANLAVAKSFDLTTVISIKNGGGIRAEIGTVQGQPIPEELPPQANPDAGKPEGGVSQLDIENSLRFNNELSLITLTAQGVLNMVENALRDAGPGLTPGAFPQVSGLKFSWDPDSPVKDRVVDLAIVNQQGEVIDIIAHNGELVGDAAREFRIVTLNFLAEGGDGIIYGGPENATQLQVYSDAAALDRVDLTGAGSGFGLIGGEQAALADYLGALHGTPDTAFDEADTSPADDERIQNLDARDGDVLGEGPVKGAALADLVVGTSEADDLGGRGGADSIYGAGGDDVLGGGKRDDLLSGGAGNDSLVGGKDNDTLLGGDGDDRLNGRTGDDLLQGGAGTDRFVFFTAAGNDTIADFEIGTDRIVLKAFGFGDFDDVLAAMTDTADGVLLDLGVEGSVLIEDAARAALEARDFIL